jgi:hypothetical protein
VRGRRYSCLYLSSVCCVAEVLRNGYKTALRFAKHIEREFRNAQATKEKRRTKRKEKQLLVLAAFGFQN